MFQGFWWIMYAKYDFAYTSIRVSFINLHNIGFKTNYPKIESAKVNTSIT